MPARGGKSGYLLLKNWEMGIEDMTRRGMGREGNQEWGRRCDLRLGEGKLGTQWLSVACLLLRPPSPHLLLTQLWDIGGQPRFRSMWERYCRGVSAIV